MSDRFRAVWVTRAMARGAVKLQNSRATVSQSVTVRSADRMRATTCLRSHTVTAASPAT